VKVILLIEGFGVQVYTFHWATGSDLFSGIKIGDVGSMQLRNTSLVQENHGGNGVKSLFLILPIFPKSILVPQAFFLKPKKYLRRHPDDC
jgi:hypothetical protein